MNAQLRAFRFGLATVAALAVVGCKSQSDGDHAGIPPDAKIEETAEVKPNASVHIAAADLAVGQGNAAEAITQYNRALDLDSTNRDALYKLATVQTLTRQFDRAIPLWQRYVDATHGSANALSNLGRAFELSGDWKQAEVQYLAAIAKEPGNRAARVNYGILLAKRERIDEATTQLGKALVPAEVQYNLGSVCELRQDYARARSHYERALSFDPQLTAARQRLDLLRSVTNAN